MNKKNLFYRNCFWEYSNYLRRQMTAAKNKFAEKLRATRQRSWQKFAETDLKTNPWGTVIQGSGGEISPSRGPKLLFQGRRDNHRNSGADNATPDRSGNDRILIVGQRDYYSIEPKEAADDKFNEKELDVITLNNNKAPGPDQIKGNIVKLAHSWAGPAVLKIYNACWKLGNFPQT
jgi:hypothetical protein